MMMMMMTVLGKSTRDENITRLGSLDIRFVERAARASAAKPLRENRQRLPAC